VNVQRLRIEAADMAVVRQVVAHGTDARQAADPLRYALSFARLTAVRNRDGVDVDVSDALGRFRAWVVDELVPQVEASEDPRQFLPQLPDLARRVVELRQGLLDHLPLDIGSLETEIATRSLVVASGGGGGAGYVYPGCFEVLDRAGFVPALMAGTSMGSLMGIFRARHRVWDMGPLVAAARRLRWTGVFRVLDMGNRYGMPATLRLYLRSTLGPLFQHPEGRPLWLSDLEIPLLVMVTGITLDALKHDLAWYEHLLDDEIRRGVMGSVRGMVKALALLREFLARRDALVDLPLGALPGTEDFDVLDACGFSSSIPGIIHYDVLRDDPRMKRVLDDVYARYGVARMGEGGIVQNVPARAAWEAVQAGRIGHRNAFVVALDCFAPNAARLPWYPLQQAVRSANVDADRRYAHLYVPLGKTLSPMQLVPSVADAFSAIRWGREQMEPWMPVVREAMRPLPMLR
jgi:predicted acylesterase/phospholipase RssA